MGSQEVARVGMEGEEFKDPNQKEAAREFWKSLFWPRLHAWSSFAITSLFLPSLLNPEMSELTTLSGGLSLSLAVGFCLFDLLLL